MTSKLKSLGEYVYDSVEGYQAASEKAEDPRLTQAFAQRLSKRQQTLNQINSAIVQQGGKEVTGGSTLGTFHEMWTRLTSALDKGDEAIVERVEEGEDFLKERFEEALKDDDLTAQDRQVISQCLEEVAQGEFFSDQLEAQYDN